MTLHIIVDGYNLIRQSSRLASFEHRSLESGREALIQWLSNYNRFKSHRITVVFDGTQGIGFSNQNRRQGGVHVIFSPPGESADTVIKRLAAHEREKALVVTSDRDVAAAAESHLAATISSQDFEEKLHFVTGIEATKEPADEELQGWRPTTKKKGPRKRDPKRVRRNQKRIMEL